MEHGTILEQGTHDELLAAAGPRRPSRQSRYARRLPLSQA